MVYRTFECGGCETIVEVKFNSVHDKVPQTITDVCDNCDGYQLYRRVFEAPYHTFGMLSQKYSGQLAAVKGYGSHQLDYNVGDLARRRAVDATMKFNEKANLGHVNESLNQAIKNEQQA